MSLFGNIDTTKTKHTHTHTHTQANQQNLFATTANAFLAPRFDPEIVKYLSVLSWLRLTDIRHITFKSCHKCHMAPFAFLISSPSSLERVESSAKVLGLQLDAMSTVGTSSQDISEVCIWSSLPIRYFSLIFLFPFHSLRK